MKIFTFIKPWRDSINRFGSYQKQYLGLLCFSVANLNEIFNLVTKIIIFWLVYLVFPEKIRSEFGLIISTQQDRNVFWDYEAIS